MWLPKLVCTNETIWNKTNILNVPITQSFKFLGFRLGASQGLVCVFFRLFVCFLHNAWFGGLLLQNFYFIKCVCVCFHVNHRTQRELPMFIQGRMSRKINLWI